MTGPRIVRVQAGGVPDEALREAVAVIRSGGIVVHPTETVYGLAVDPWNEGAVRRLVKLKGREVRSGLILMTASAGEALRLAASPAPAAVAALVRAFWPGPLTLVLSPGPEAPRAVLGKDGGLAVRFTSDPIAQVLVAAAGRALTSTSANLAGEAPAETAQRAVLTFGDRVDLVLDAGPRNARAGSTLLDLTGPAPRILREGELPRVRIEEVLGGVVE